MASGIANVRFVGRVAGGGRRRRGGQDPAAGRVHGGLDAMVLPGGCLPLGATGMPFSPIVEVLRGLSGDGASPDGLPPVLARLVPGLPADPSPPPSSQAELFQAFLGLLERLAADRTVVLVLEDLHWADRSTRQLLAFVVHALRSQPLPVVVTYRADDLHRQHPLRPLLAELRRNPRSRRIELPPFAPAEVAEYLAARGYLERQRAEKPFMNLELAGWPRVGAGRAGGVGVPVRRRACVRRGRAGLHRRPRRAAGRRLPVRHRVTR